MFYSVESYDASSYDIFFCFSMYIDTNIYVIMIYVYYKFI